MKARKSTKSTTPKPKKDLTWNGKKYKSPLEVFTAKALFEAGLPNHYEEWKVPLMEKFTCTCPSWEVQEKTIKGTTRKEKVWKECSGNVQKMTYSPDFPSAPNLEEIEGGWCFEVKGLRTNEFNLKWKLFKDYLTTHNTTVTLYMPKNREQVQWCINHIKTNHETRNVD